MKTYNRALDYTVLALNELKNGKMELAAKLFATAGKQADLSVAIATLEASNKYAFALQANSVTASKRLRANDEFPFGNETEVSEEQEIESDLDTETDPLDEVEDGDEEITEEPSAAMARVLTSMVGKRTKR